MHLEQPYNETTLLAQLATGDRGAFERLYNHYRPRLYDTTLKFLKSRELSEEVVQEVFLKLWLNAADIPFIKDFRAWLFTLTRNLAVDCLRRMARETSALEEYELWKTPENNAEHRLLEKQYDELLQSAVDKLPPQQKIIYRMSRQEYLSHEAIAAKLNLSYFTVKAHMNKALQTIRAALQHHMNVILLLSMLPLWGS